MLFSCCPGLAAVLHRFNKLTGSPQHSPEAMLLRGKISSHAYLAPWREVLWHLELRARSPLGGSRPRQRQLLRALTEPSPLAPRGLEASRRGSQAQGTNSPQVVLLIVQPPNRPEGSRERGRKRERKRKLYREKERGDTKKFL